MNILENASIAGIHKFYGIPYFLLEPLQYLKLEHSRTIIFLTAWLAECVNWFLLRMYSTVYHGCAIRSADNTVGKARVVCGHESGE